MDKLQRAGRHFLLRRIAKHGPHRAARVQRALADELDALVGDDAVGAALATPLFHPRKQASGDRSLAAP